MHGLCGLVQNNVIVVVFVFHVLTFVTFVHCAVECSVFKCYSVHSAVECSVFNVTVFIVL